MALKVTLDEGRLVVRDQKGEPAGTVTEEGLTAIKQLIVLPRHGQQGRAEVPVAAGTSSGVMCPAEPEPPESTS